MQHHGNHDTRKPLYKQMFEHDISCQIMCSTEILINFDVNMQFLPYENQYAQYLCKKIRISRYVVEKQNETKLSAK